MHAMFVPGRSSAAIPIQFVTAATWARVRAGLDPQARAFAESVGFEPGPGQHLFLIFLLCGRQFGFTVQPGGFVLLTGFKGLL